MNRVLLLVLALVCSSVVVAAPKERTYFRLLETNVERKEVDGKVKTTLHFIIIWENIDVPALFYWRGENGWTPCKVDIAHKMRTGNKKNVYRIVEVTPDLIHKGDTIQVTPLPGGKFRLPAEVSPSSRNTLYFKTGGSNYLDFPVRNVPVK